MFVVKKISEQLIDDNSQTQTLLIKQIREIQTRPRNFSKHFSNQNNDGDKSKSRSSPDPEETTAPDETTEPAGDGIDHSIK